MKRICRRESCDGCDILYCAYCKYWHVNGVDVLRQDNTHAITLATGICLAPMHGHCKDFETNANEIGCRAFAFVSSRRQCTFRCRHTEECDQ